MPPPARQEVIAFRLRKKITDKRKRNRLFGISLQTNSSRILILVKGVSVVVLATKPNNTLPLFPFPIYPMNYVSNEKELVDIYNAVDLYVTPSLQDNHPIPS